MKVVKFIIFYIFVFIKNMEAFQSMGPLGNVIINSIYECPENESPTSDLMATWTARINDDNGKKSLTGTMNLKIPLDDNVSYVLILKKWENGSWKKYYELKGKLCTDIHKVLPKLWSKVVPSITPDPGRKCPAKPDTYTVTNLQVNTKDVDFKAIFYGRLLMKATAFDKDNNYVFCGMAEADSQAI